MVLSAYPIVEAAFHPFTAAGDPSKILQGKGHPCSCCSCSGFTGGSRNNDPPDEKGISSRGTGMRQRAVGVCVALSHGSHSPWLPLLSPHGARWMSFAPAKDFPGASLCLGLQGTTTGPRGLAGCA